MDRLRRRARFPPMPRLPPRPVIYEINTIAWLSGLSRRAGAAVTLASVPEGEWDALGRSESTPCG